MYVVTYIYINLLMFDEVASQEIPGIARLPLTFFQLKADEMIDFASLCTAKFVYTRSFWTSLQNDLKCWVSQIYAEFSQVEIKVKKVLSHLYIYI